MQNTFRVFFRSLFLGGALICLVVAGAFLACKPPLLENLGFSRAVYDRNGQLLRLTLSPDHHYRLFTPLKDISPQFRDAVLLHEDRFFYSHIGVNPVSLIRATWQTATGGRRVGASTISMQLARMQYGIHSHRVTGKLLQIASALQLEAHYSKDELFEAYLNRASYGYNIEGVGAASAVYFHETPQRLTLPEALTLAVIPQSPLRRRPDPHDPAKPALIAARNGLFNQWCEERPEDNAQQVYFTLPLMVYGRADLPFDLPQLTYDLLRHHRDEQRITASVDLDMQDTLAKILQRYVGDHGEIGIRNASALLVDSRNMHVMASIGSVDFNDAEIDGQIDGTRAKRSPGSTLKPFIYAMAIDQGLIHPLSILGDVPVTFGSYAPDNFDKDFRGPISARDALRLSRNVPAIKLAAEIHKPDLYDFMKSAGITNLRDREHYGLSLVLGGAEVTMRELATLYAVLANDGIMKPLVTEIDDVTPVKPLRLLSPEASFMTLDMLATRPKEFTASSNRTVYWKTGTSNGFHDAWTAGVFGHYVLVVWVGNFNGANNPALVGARAAAPVFFQLIDAVNGKEPNPDLIEAKSSHLAIHRIDVCATTGDVSLDNCPAPDKGWFIPGVSPIHNHDVYRKILVDMRTGERACRYDAGLTEYRTFEVWPTELQRTLENAGIHKDPLPSWSKDCEGQANNEATGDEQKPTITSPQSGVEYHAHINDASDTVPFIANADGEAQTLHWFVNNEYLGTSKPSEPLSWHPEPGKYRVSVVDDQGRASSTNMQVTLIQ